MQHVTVTIPINTDAIQNQDEDMLEIEVRLGQHTAALIAGLPDAIAAGAFQIEIPGPSDPRVPVSQGEQG